MFAQIMVCPNKCCTPKAKKLQTFETKLAWLNHMSGGPKGALRDEEWEIVLKSAKPRRIKTTRPAIIHEQGSEDDSSFGVRSYEVYEDADIDEFDEISSRVGSRIGSRVGSKASSRASSPDRSRSGTPDEVSPYAGVDARSLAMTLAKVSKKR